MIMKIKTIYFSVHFFVFQTSGKYNGKFEEELSVLWQSLNIWISSNVKDSKTNVEINKFKV